MVHIVSRTTLRGNRSKKCRAVRLARTSLATRVHRLVRRLGVRVAGVVLELVGCVMLSVRVKPGEAREVRVQLIRALWAELTP